MILIYPHKLSDIAKVKMILDYLKYPYTYDKSQEYDLVFNSNVNPKHIFDLKTNKYVINRHCVDVTKRNVDILWERITGRQLIINPELWKGYCVEKPDLQGTNSGKIVKCPYEPINGMVYQKMIDTRDGKGMQDIRVVVARNEIILTIIKYKPLTMMFNNPHDFEYVDKKDVFTNEEINNILIFCNEIGLDFGELDVLRSNFDGQIYVVDVNNLAGYGYFRNKEKLKYVANVFKNKFL